jgi:hypothetical protein
MITFAEVAGFGLASDTIVVTLLVPADLAEEFLIRF